MKTAKKYCIIRSANAGVFAGIVESRKGDEVRLSNCRRVWYWKGAATLSQLAIDGTSDPAGCKFPAPTKDHTVLGVCEVIVCSAKARKSIELVPVWRQ